MRCALQLSQQSQTTFSAKQSLLWCVVRCVLLLLMLCGVWSVVAVYDWSGECSMPFLNNTFCWLGVYLPVLRKSFHLRLNVFRICCGVFHSFRLVPRSGRVAGRWLLVALNMYIWSSWLGASCLRGGGCFWFGMVWFGFSVYQSAVVSTSRRTTFRIRRRKQSFVSFASTRVFRLSHVVSEQHQFFLITLVARLARHKLRTNERTIRARHGCLLCIYLSQTEIHKSNSILLCMRQTFVTVRFPSI